MRSLRDAGSADIRKKGASRLCWDIKILAGSVNCIWTRKILDFYLGEAGVQMRQLVTWLSQGHTAGECPKWPHTLLPFLQGQPLARESPTHPQKSCKYLVLHQKPATSEQMAGVMKFILIPFQKALLEIESGIVGQRALSKNHEMDVQRTWCCRDRLGEAAGSFMDFNPIITVTSISRWDSTNNNIYNVISILSHRHFPRTSGGKGITIPGNSLLPLNIVPPFN